MLLHLITLIIRLLHNYCYAIGEYYQWCFAHSIESLMIFALVGDNFIIIFSQSNFNTLALYSKFKPNTARNKTNVVSFLVYFYPLRFRTDQFKYHAIRIRHFAPRGRERMREERRRLGKTFSAVCYCILWQKNDL